MNVLAGNVSSSQNLTFTRNPYGFWFNGTNEAYGLPGSKLEDSSFINSGVGSIALYLTQVYKNGILIYNNLDEVFYAESNLDYNFRDDGYGIGRILQTVLSRQSQIRIISLRALQIHPQ
jgi:hypothetical protein